MDCSHFIDGAAVAQEVLEQGSKPGQLTPEPTYVTPRRGKEDWGLQWDLWGVARSQ